MITTKLIKCKHCDFDVQLVVKVDEDGLATQRGWSKLREHWNMHHKPEARALDLWLNAGEEVRMPNDIEKILQQGWAEEQCGRSAEAA